MRTLMYHDIVAPGREDHAGFPGPLAARYKLTWEHFTTHLDTLAAHALDVGIQAHGKDDPSVLISFDDGGASAVEAAEALERRGWRGHFFVTTSRIDTTGFLTASEVRALADAGHRVGSHSHTHPTYMGRLSHAELEHEWRESRERLGEALGSPPESASVPGGYLSDDVIVAAQRAGYRTLFTSEPTARIARSGSMEVRGRYTIWATTPASVALGYARGDAATCGRLWLEWNTKKAAKRVSPRVYQALRRVRARIS